MYQMEKITTGVSYTTSAVGTGYWFLQLLDRVSPSQWAAIGVLGSLLFGLLTYLTNLYFKIKEDRRKAARESKLMSRKLRYGLSAAVLALIAAGASAPEILDQFLDEKEGNHTTAYRDGAGIWTICRGAILVDGKPVVPGMKLSKEKCDRVNAIERDKALAWVAKNIKVPLTDPQKAGIASFCPYNIGPGKCFPSTFYKRINAGDRKGACEAIRWWIKDGGRDCRIRSNNCYGQVSRRDQESALACWGIDR